MTTYSGVFGGNTIPSAEASYGALSLIGNVVLSWPKNTVGGSLLYDIVDISSTGAYTITLPPANEVSVGQNSNLNNLSIYTLSILDATGNPVGTIPAGAVKNIYLVNNTTAAGVWEFVAFGSGTTPADAAALRGYGLKVTGSTLSQDYPVIAATANVSLTAADRSAMRVFTGSGAVTCTFPDPLVVGNGYFVNVANQGTGSVALTPYSGTIDGVSAKSLAPGESATVVCDGLNLVTIGYGRSTQFQFTKLVLDISSGTPLTLTSAQAQNKLIQFVGIVTGNVVVNVPAVVAIYYTQCSYSGSFTVTMKTAAGTGISLNNTDRAILYCDGVDVVQAQTSAVPATTITGGVAGSVLYQSGPNITGFTPAGVAGQVLLSGGPSAPSWGSLAAGNVSVTPVGGISSTTVQAALAELDSEKAAATNPNTSGMLTHNGSGVFAGNRPISFDPATGVARIKGDNGPWAIQYAFYGPAGADYGGFGAYGNANVLGYYYIGPSYNAPVLRAYPSGNVSIGTAADDYRLYVANNAATSTVPASNIIARLQSNGAGADATIQFSDGVANAASISMTGGTLRLAPLGDTLHTSSRGGLGYGQGAGGTAVQPTSKSTNVTSNTPSGRVTMNSETLAAGASVAFIIDCNKFEEFDGVVVTGKKWSVRYRIESSNTAAGQIGVRITNISGEPQSDPLVIDYQVIKGATA